MNIIESIDWIKEEESGRWNNPNLVAFCLIEAMSEKAGMDLETVFAPFKPESLQVEFKVNGVSVSFKGCMQRIQKAIAEIEQDCRKSLITEAANALINELTDKINQQDWQP